LNYPPSNRLQASKRQQCCEIQAFLFVPLEKARVQRFADLLECRVPKDKVTAILMPIYGILALSLMIGIMLKHCFYFLL
jgi:hypothetical protein